MVPLSDSVLRHLRYSSFKATEEEVKAMVSELMHRRSTPPASTNILTNWKDVAAFFNVGTRTVQRWEKHLGMPTHRKGGGIFFVDTEELKTWAVNRPRGRGL